MGYNVKKINKLKEKRKVKELIKALNCKNGEDVRKAAAEALGNLGEPQ